MPKSSRVTVALPTAILAVGAALRLREYFHNRSLWIDEASLAVGLLGRAPSGLLEPLPHHQAAPPAFLFAEKAIVAVAGSSELALRLLPLLAALAALLLFSRTVSRLLDPATGAVASAMFALSPWMVRYAAEVKQYSLDVLVTVVLLTLALPLFRQPFRFRRLVVLGIGGTLAMWFAFPAIILLAAIGVVCFAAALRSRDRSRIVATAAVGAVWLGSFLVLYLVQLRGIRANQGLGNWWQVHGGFPPTAFFSAETLEWYFRLAYGFFANPGGLEATAAALLLAIVGVWHFWKADRWLLGVLGAPGIVALLVSAAGAYPLFERVGLYLTPLLYVLIAQGLAVLWRAHRTAGVVAGGVLFATPLLQAADRVVAPRGLEELRPVLGYVQRTRQAGDRLVVYYGGAHAFEYYALRGTIAPAVFDSIGIRRERRDWQRTTVRQFEAAELAGPRLWLIISHSHTGDGVDEGRLLARAAARGYQVLDSTSATGATALLLTPRPLPPVP